MMKKPVPFWDSLAQRYRIEKLFLLKKIPKHYVQKTLSILCINLIIFRGIRIPINPSRIFHKFSLITNLILKQSLTPLKIHLPEATVNLLSLDDEPLGVRVVDELALGIVVHCDGSVEP